MLAKDTFSRFFDPKSIMIVGASRTSGKAGNIILENIIANGYQGKVFPINPSAEEILGIKCFPSIADAPEVPDLTVLAVPAEATLETILQCAEKKSKALVITTAGFAEVDDSGAKLQTNVLEVAQRAGMRVMGPNTSGITSTPCRFSASLFPLGLVKKGAVSCIAQTGNFATHTMKWILTGENFGVSRVAGLGNKIDVDEAELLEYFGNDFETRVILLYLEGFKDGRRFLEVARKISQHKPIIAMKAGRTESGIRAVASHTASMASNDMIIDSAFKQAGVVRIQSYANLVDTAKVLSMQSVPKGNRVAVLAPSGAMGIVAADACERLGLKVAALSEKTFRALSEIFPSYINVGNPIDIWGAAITRGVYEAYETGLRVVLEDEGVDAVLCIMNLAPETIFGKHELDVNKLNFISELAREHPSKLLMVAISGDKSYYEAAKKHLEEHSVPVFLPVEPALEALVNIDQCRRYLNAGA